MATNGSASAVTCEPNWLIVSADQSLRKSGCRQRPPFGHSVRMVRRLARAARPPLWCGVHEGRRSVEEQRGERLHEADGDQVAVSPNASRAGPVAVSTSGPSSDVVAMIAAHAFGRSAAGVRE